MEESGVSLESGETSTEKSKKKKRTLSPSALVKVGPPAAAFV